MESGEAGVFFTRESIGSSFNQITLKLIAMVMCASIGS
jgi:hypothetical protein